MSADSWSYEDPQFTRAMWRMSIAMNASTPGYAQWVQQTKKSLALLQEPRAMSLGQRFGVALWNSTLTAAEPTKDSFNFVLHSTG